MKCSICGADLADGVLFCRECGNRIGTAQKRFCRVCGAKLKQGEEFCTECGARIEVSTAIPSKKLSKEPNVYDAPADTVIADSSNSKEYKERPPADKLEKSKTSGTNNKKKKKNTNKATTPKKQTSKQKKKKRRLLPIIMTVVGVVLLILLVSGVVKRGGLLRSANAPPPEQKISMVDVSNMSYSAAIEVLQSAGFTNITSNVDPNIDESLWVVTGQSVNPGKTIKASETIQLTCGRKCRLYIDVKSEGNLLFSTYDILISIDGNEIGTVENGKEFTRLVEIVTGEHTLTFCKLGDSSPSATRKISVSGDMTFSCDLAHSGSSIDIKNESITDNVDAASLEVIDVTGMVLSEAMDKLKEIGFSNVHEEPSDKIWDKDNWIVVTQGLAVGTTTDKNEFFQLDCISFDDYFKNTYVGKNANEIQTIAEESGFSVIFEDYYVDVSEKIASMSQEEKSEWIATDARQYGGGQKTAVITIENPNEVEYMPIPTPTPEPVETPSISTENTKNNAVSYSTNDMRTAKNGNTGIYAYRNNGKSYYIYYVIDFDEGYVYRFLDGNGEDSCEKVKIESGNLNDVVIITYHEGGTIYSNGLRFRWRNQPEHLVLEDQDHYEWDFYSTNLEDALSKRDTKRIIEY